MFKFFKKNTSTIITPVISEPMNNSNLPTETEEIFTYQIKVGFALIKVFYKYKQNKTTTIVRSTTKRVENKTVKQTEIKGAIYDLPISPPKSIIIQEKPK